jgi:peptidase YpeB-like protein
MNLKRNALVAGAAAAILAAGGVGVANAVSDADGGATGPGADQARAAALRLIPGGTANAVERDGEKGATWEVEVRRPDGSTVDVRLGASYEKVAIDVDSEAN